MKKHKYAHPIAGVLEQICDIMQDGTKVGADLLSCLCDGKAPMLCQPVKLPKLFPLLPLPLSLCSPFDRGYFASGCGCDIPPPCWAPQPLGDVACTVCPGDTATIRVHVTNCGATSRVIKIEAAGAGVSVNPPSLSLGPMERREATVALTMPADAEHGSQREILVWVRGCHDHYLRWRVYVGTRLFACPDVHVEDCPDYVHHWYDHFYCDRPCVQGR